MDAKRVLASLGVQPTWDTRQVPGLVTESPIMLDGTLPAGAAAAGDTLVADVTDANRASPKLRATNPWRGVVGGMRIFAPGATLAELEVIGANLGVRFAVQGATYEFAAAPFLGLYGGSDGAATPNVGAVGPTLAMPLPQTVTFEGVATDRVVFYADGAATFAALGLQVLLAGAFVSPDLDGGREALLSSQPQVPGFNVKARCGG